MSDGARRARAAVSRRRRWRAAAGISLTVAAAALGARPHPVRAQAPAPAPAPPTTGRVAPAEPGITSPDADAPRPSRFSRQAEQEITFQEGLLHYSQRQLELAERDFRSVIAEDPADAEAYYYLGLTQLDANRPAEAVESFNQSLRLDPTSDEVRAARAAAFIRVRRFDDARQDLAALEMDPRWAGNVAYLRGQMLYAQGDLEGAADFFGEARRLGGTEAAPAKFYEGLTYLRMKELVRARSAFREAGLGAERDPSVAAASRQIDAVLAAQQPRPDKPWEFALYAGYEYDTNVTRLGEYVLLPEEVTEADDGRAVVQPRGSYSLVRRDGWDVGVEGTSYFTFHHDLSEADITYYQAGPYITFPIAKNLFGSARYGFNYYEYGHDPLLERHIVTPQLTWVQPRFGYTSAFYQYQAREFTDENVVFVRAGSPTGPFVDVFDFDSELHTVGIVQGITVGEVFEGAGPSNLELSYRFEHNSAEGGDFDGDGHTVGATFYTPLPFWKLRADVGTTLGIERYDNPNSGDNDPFVLEVDDDERDDREWTISAGLTRKITEWASIRADYTYTDNDSNIEQDDGSRPYSYDRHVVGIRLILGY